MRVITLIATATVAIALPLLAATPASAEGKCYTAHVKGFDSMEFCTFLPIDPELGS